MSGIITNNANVLDKITEFAGHTHGEQMRKYCRDSYMVLPVRVMKKLPKIHKRSAYIGSCNTSRCCRSYKYNIKMILMRFC